MFCSKCGAQLDNTAKFCASCGTPVETPVTNTTPQSDQVDRQAQWNSQWSASAPSPAYNTSPISTQTKKKLQWWHILFDCFRWTNSFDFNYCRRFWIK